MVIMVCQLGLLVGVEPLHSFPLMVLGKMQILCSKGDFSWVGGSGLNGLLLCVGLSDKQHSVSKSFVCAVY